MDDIRSLIPAEHQAFIDDILARYEVPDLPAGDESAGGRGLGDASGTAAPFSAAAAGPQLEIALAHRTAFVANALGPPPKFLIDRVKAEGRLVGALAGKAVHAERHVQAGVDVIIAQGYEAGGHTGEIGSMVLIPEVVDAVAPVPVLGAGGIGRGRQMAAAMALGAQGVWCGSVWLTTDEAETHPTVKKKMLAATSADTLRSRSLTGKHARMLKSAWTEEWERADTPEPLGMPLQPILSAEAQRRINRGARARIRCREVGELLRRPDRRRHEPAKNGVTSRLRDDRGVHRCLPEPGPPTRDLTGPALVWAGTSQALTASQPARWQSPVFHSTHPL